MANNCNNYIKVQGADLTDFRNGLKEANELAKQGYGWMPKEIAEKEYDYIRFWFDTEIMDDEPTRMVLSNWTKWCWMEADQMRDFCRLYKISMLTDYEELGCQVYGRAFYDYETDEFTEVFLTQDEMDLVTYDEESDLYTYIVDGKTLTSESPDEWYSDMLDEKWGDSITSEVSKKAEDIY